MSVNAQHLKMVQSLTLTKAYIQLKLLQLLVADCSYFAKKKQKWWSHMKKHAIMDPVCDICFRFT